MLIENIALSPQRWPSYFDQFRKYTLRQFPFSIVYEELLSEIVVFAVAHARRRPGYWKDRAQGVTPASEEVAHVSGQAGKNILDTTYFTP